MKKDCKGFSLLEIVLYVALFTMCIGSYTTISFTLHNSLARTERKNSLENESLLILDELEAEETPYTSSISHIDHLRIAPIEISGFTGSETDLVLSATSTQGDRISDETQRINSDKL